ncbi:MAG: hypothetical protein NXI31_04005 [bacterium]|nr:hypothetical protein [bacterium]
MTHSISFPFRSAAVLTTLACAVAQTPVYHAATQPTQDAAIATLPGGTMLSLPGLLTDFVIGGGGQFVELPNGTARLTGRALSTSSLYSAFLVDIEFTGRVAPGNPAHPPAGRPDQQLLPAAYTPVGSVDPSQFVYYTAATGTLVGSSNYAGAILDVQLTGGAAQLGLGGNNRNDGMGLQAQFNVTVQQQPAVPFGPLTTMDLVVDLPADRNDKVTHPVADPNLAALIGGRAMTIPWVADDYVFIPAGDFLEADDGTASLTGRLVRISDLDDGWDLTLALSDRLDPGEANHPPAGSPVQLLQPSAYVGGGGTLDPASWRYYETVSGTLTGFGYNAGGSITLAQTVAFQYGGGANQFNSFSGFYGALQPTIVSHPNNRTLLIGGDIVVHGLCQVFPELPFPSLTPPAQPIVRETLTDQGILLQGDNLAWAELVGVGTTLLAAGDESDWFSGYYVLHDNQTIEIFPQPGALPGNYDLYVLTQSWRSNLLSVQLDAPATPTLMSETSIGAPDTLHVLMHRGNVAAPALSAVAMSDSLLPTVFPGIASLGIGNQQTQLTIIPGTFFHDPTNGIAQWNFGPIPAWYTGFTLHFQAVTLDLTNVTLPFPTTNIWSVDF